MVFQSSPGRSSISSSRTGRAAALKKAATRTKKEVAQRKAAESSSGGGRVSQIRAGQQEIQNIAAAKAQARAVQQTTASKSVPITLSQAESRASPALLAKIRSLQAPTPQAQQTGIPPPSFEQPSSIGEVVGSRIESARTGLPISETISIGTATGILTRTYDYDITKQKTVSSGLERSQIAKNILLPSPPPSYKEFIISPTKLAVGTTTFAIPVKVSETFEEKFLPPEKQTIISRFDVAASNALSGIVDIKTTKEIQAGSLSGGGFFAIPQKIETSSANLFSSSVGKEGLVAEFGRKTALFGLGTSHALKGFGLEAEGAFKAVKTAIVRPARPLIIATAAAAITSVSFLFPPAAPYIQTAGKGLAAAYVGIQTKRVITSTDPVVRGYVLGETATDITAAAVGGLASKGIIKAVKSFKKPEVLSISKGKSFVSGEGDVSTTQTSYNVRTAVGKERFSVGLSTKQFAVGSKVDVTGKFFVGKTGVRGKPLGLGKITGTGHAVPIDQGFASRVDYSFIGKINNKAFSNTFQTTTIGSKVFSKSSGITSFSTGGKTVVNLPKTTYFVQSATGKQFSHGFLTRTSGFKFSYKLESGKEITGFKSIFSQLTASTKSFVDTTLPASRAAAIQKVKAGSISDVVNMALGKANVKGGRPIKFVIENPKVTLPLESVSVTTTTPKPLVLDAASAAKAITSQAVISDVTSASAVLFPKFTQQNQINDQLQGVYSFTSQEQRPITDTFQVTGTDLRSSRRFKAITEASISASGRGSISGMVTSSASKMGTALDSITKQESAVKLKPIIDSPLTVVPTTTPIPTPRIPILVGGGGYFPDIPIIKPSRGFGFSRKSKFRFQYAPSLVALEYDITASKIPKFSAGLGIRPIVGKKKKEEKKRRKK